MKSERTETVWLKADFCFAATYSCRLLMSNMGSAQAIPTPGPGTIRLALIRAGIELFGSRHVRDELFPIICSADIAVRPPERIAISIQTLHVYKASMENQRANVRLNETIIYREFAHATGPMTIYLRVPMKQSDVICTTLMAIGYWGQASSLTQCTAVEVAAPELSECATPLQSINPQAPVHNLITGFVTELRDSYVTWEEVVIGRGQQWTNVTKPELYVWPMHIIEHHGSDRLLLRCSILNTDGSRADVLKSPGTFNVEKANIDCM